MKRSYKDRRFIQITRTDTDAQFFLLHPDRQAHIRRAASGEEESSFQTLGPHLEGRRRIILWRVPPDNPYWSASKQPLLKIPLLLYADETVEDTDEVLLPEVARIMQNAAVT